MNAGIHRKRYKNYITIQNLIRKTAATQLKFYELRLLRHINLAQYASECKHSGHISQDFHGSE